MRDTNVNLMSIYAFGTNSGILIILNNHKITVTVFDSPSQRLTSYKYFKVMVPYKIPLHREKYTKFSLSKDAVQTKNISLLNYINSFDLKITIPF